MPLNTFLDSSFSLSLGPGTGTAPLSRALLEDSRYPYYNSIHRHSPYQYPGGIPDTPDTLPSPPQSSGLISPSSGYSSGFAGQDMPFDISSLYDSPTSYHHPDSPTQNMPMEILSSFFHVNHYATSPPQPFPQSSTPATSTTSHYRISKPSALPTIANPMKCHWPGCRYTGSFSKKGQLTRHVNTQHISPRSFQCPEPGCGKAFHRKDNLGEHTRRIHLGKFSQVMTIDGHSC